jgi:hypothetical protein
MGIEAVNKHVKVSIPTHTVLASNLFSGGVLYIFNLNWKTDCKYLNTLRTGDADLRF